ncbi:MAG: hypothetical protein RL322_2699, partial [Pseudomonadota bacterium]
MSAQFSIQNLTKVSATQYTFQVVLADASSVGSFNISLVLNGASLASAAFSTAGTSVSNWAFSSTGLSAGAYTDPNDVLGSNFSAVGAVLLNGTLNLDSAPTASFSLGLAQVS